MASLENRWLSCLSYLDYAFQPIVDIQTGACFGCEALLRNYEAAGFKTIDELFHQAFEDGVLYQIDYLLQEKAVERFSRLEWKQEASLFYNLDGRIMMTDEYKPENMMASLRLQKHPHVKLCFEIILAENIDITDIPQTAEILDAFRSLGYKIAVDDYGSADSLQLLYYISPDFVKIDRFFIRNIVKNAEDKLFASSIVGNAHNLGSQIIAEGVETKAEYIACKEIGCDLIQGYYVKPPELDILQIRRNYQHIELINRPSEINSPLIDPYLNIEPTPVS
jgi:EAL domain-containing protein (putative c-di-GMP-specific phosphodiesterase class I)